MNSIENDHHESKFNNKNGLNVNNEGSIKAEGLLCPKCFEKFRTINQLMIHYDQQHLPSDDNTVLNFKLNNVITKSNVKNFVQKLITSPTSNKSLNNVNKTDVKTQNIITNSYDGINEWKNFMKIGTKRSYWEYFNQIRSKQTEHCALKTNKLLIHLNQLIIGYQSISINDNNSDSIKNKQIRQMEQSIVKWIDDSIVSLCPTCAVKFNYFNFKTRRHHCRLCGTIMCTNCSKFLSMEFANDLLDSFFNGDRNHRGQNINNSNIQIKHNSIRICDYCDNLLKIRLLKYQKSNHHHELNDLYGKLRKNFDKIEQLSTIYVQKSTPSKTGIQRGYNSADLIKIKEEILQLNDENDHLSRQIETLNLTKTLPSSKQLQIQTMIRQSTIKFTNEIMIKIGGNK